MVSSMFREHRITQPPDWMAWDLKADEAQNDFPQLKYALLGGVGLFLLIQKEQ